VAKGDHPPGSAPFDVRLPEGLRIGCTDRRLRRQPSRRVARSSAMARSLSCATTGRRTRTTRRGLSRRRWACRWRASPSGCARNVAGRTGSRRPATATTSPGRHCTATAGPVGRCPKRRAALRIMGLAGARAWSAAASGARPERARHQRSTRARAFTMEACAWRTGIAASLIGSDPDSGAIAFPGQGRPGLLPARNTSREFAAICGTDLDSDADSRSSACPGKGILGRAGCALPLVAEDR
jgi:hypothetical protein